MKRYKISTAEKKNVFIRTEYVVNNGIAAGKTFFTSEWYRWGSCVVEVEDDQPAPAASADPYEYPLDLDSYIVEEQESDDGCTFEFDFSDEWTADEIKHIETLWDDGEFWDAVDAEDSWTEYYGPLDVELL